MIILRYIEDFYVNDIFVELYYTMQASIVWLLNILLWIVFWDGEYKFLANVNVAICRRPSVCRLSVVCLSSVTFARPTHAIEIFVNVSTPFGTLAIRDLSVKILRRSFQGNPSVGELNTRGVAEYSDFGPIDGYISETVQDMR